MASFSSSLFFNDDMDCFSVDSSIKVKEKPFFSKFSGGRVFNKSSIS